MSYPMGPAITFHQFIDRASSDYGVSKAQGPTVITATGRKTSLVLSRSVNGIPIDTTVFDIAEDERLLPNTIRRLCACLQIPPSDFGLHLE